MKKLHQVKLTKDNKSRIETMDGSKYLIQRFYKQKGYKVEILSSAKITYV